MVKVFLSTHLDELVDLVCAQVLGRFCSFRLGVPWEIFHFRQLEQLDVFKSFVYFFGRDPTLLFNFWTNKLEYYIQTETAG